MSLLEEKCAPEWVTDLLIDGRQVRGLGTPIDVFNPANGDVIATVPSATDEQVDLAVTAARRAFDHGPWGRASGETRSKLLHAFTDAFEAMHDELAAGIVFEVGAPVSLARGLQTAVGMQVMRHYADLAGVDRTENLGEDNGVPRGHSIVNHLPMGVVGVITAYNMPLQIAARAMGGALAAGCTIVLMPSPRTPLTTLLFARAAERAGLPEGVINVVVGDSQAGRRLTTHPDVDKVAFTGSVEVGRLIMGQAADRVRPLSLELGGKSPSLVLPGVDLSEVTYDLHVRYLRNGGQGCAAPTRILVHEDSYGDFVGLSREALPRIPTGDPWDPATVVGPLIRAEHIAGIRAKVDAAVAAGAKVVAEGPATPDGPGWYMSPLLIGGVTNDAQIAQQELFGPVGVVVPYGTVDEAVALCNATEFGLSANIYAPSSEEGLRIAPRLRSGTVVVNGGGAFRPEAPFGGFKHSGFGREYGEWGVREFLQPQHIQWRVD